MLNYEKLFKLLTEHGYTATKIRETGIIGQATYYGLKNGTKGLDAKTINKLCALFNCQPSDLMEYIPDKSNLDKIDK